MTLTLCIFSRPASDSESIGCCALQDVRIDFQFDTAAFDLAALPFKIPYPVPFKLLGDETKVQASSPVAVNLQDCQ